MVKFNNNIYNVINKNDDVINNMNDFNSKLFDHIYCIHYLPYKDRLSACKKELSRVNILDNKNFEFYYTVPNKYYDLLFYNTEKIDASSVNITNINYTVNSYNLLKQIYELGYERVLILEDDVVFLKDIQLFMSYINNIPIDYDLILLEYFIYANNTTADAIYNNIITTHKKINDYFFEFKLETIFDTGMFVLSRKMIKHIIDNDECLLKPFDGYTRFANTADDSDIKRCISRIPLCIQKEYEMRQENTEFIDKYSIFNKELYAI